MRKAKSLIRLGGCPGCSESSLGATHFVGFVMSRIILPVSRISVKKLVVSEVLRFRCSESDCIGEAKICTIASRRYMIN